MLNVAKSFQGNSSFEVRSAAARMIAQLLYDPHAAFNRIAFSQDTFAVFTLLRVTEFVTFLCFTLPCFQ